MLLEAFDHGITHFDLANNYGPPAGSAETNFGSVMASDLGRYRDELVISTKAGYWMWDGPYGEWGSRKYLTASLDQSLRRMGVDYVDIFYSHRFDPSTPLEETMGALDSAVRAGKALYAGISSYGPDKTREAAAILRDLGTPCLIHQPSYSMLNRWVEDGLLDVLGDEGIGCIVFSPLAQGLLSDKYLNGVPESSRAVTGDSFDQKMLAEDNLARVRGLERDRPRAGSNSGPDGGGLGAAGPASHFSPGRRPELVSDPGSAGRPGQPRTSRARNWRRSMGSRSMATSTCGPPPARPEPPP